MRKHYAKKSSPIFKWGGLVAFAFTLFAIFGNQGLLKLHQMRQTEKRLEQMIANIHTENNKLAREVENLHDTKYLEKVIREELGLLTPNEIVYYIERH